MKLSLNYTGPPSMIGLPQNSAILPLDTLRCNECARIVDLFGDSGTLHRLDEMGLCVGTEVQMIRPGKPCIVVMCGKRLSLRLEAGTEILVEVASSNQAVSDSV